MLLLGGAQVVLRVEMPCSGCSDAVKRVLGKMPGTPSKCWTKHLHLHSTDLHWQHPYSHEHVLVHMPCCAAGVESFEVSLEEQKVVVRGDVTPEAVLEKVAKTGKKTELWS